MAGVRTLRVATLRGVWREVGEMLLRMLRRLLGRLLFGLFLKGEVGLAVVGLAC